tara:strand:+ start:439 stop:552 length:114 start_codon:yes stop_codon:yes gene_type:complete
MEQKYKYLSVPHVKEKLNLHNVVGLIWPAHYKKIKND